MNRQNATQLLQLLVALEACAATGCQACRFALRAFADEHVTLDTGIGPLGKDALRELDERFGLRRV